MRLLRTDTPCFGISSVNSFTHHRKVSGCLSERRGPGNLQDATPERRFAWPCAATSGTRCVGDCEKSSAARSSASSSSPKRLAASGWRQLGAVAIDGRRLQAQAPGQHVGVLAVLEGHCVRHVDRLRDRPEIKGCTVAIMRMWRSTDNAPARPHGLVQSKSLMLRLQVRRPLPGHRAAAEAVGGVDLGTGEAERRQQLEGAITQRARRDPQNLDGSAQQPRRSCRWPLVWPFDPAREGTRPWAIKPIRSVSAPATISG